MSRKTVCMSWTTLALALIAFTAWAGSPLVVDDASIHSLEELEWVPAYETLRSGSVDTRTATLSLATGLNSRAEISVRAGYGWLRDRDPAAPRAGEGVLDLNLGVKGTLWEAGSVPFRFSASGAVKIPTATVKSGLGTGYADFTGLGIGTFILGTVLVDLNAGFTWTAVEQRSRRTGDAWFAGSAVRWRVTDPLLFFAESYASKPTAPGVGSAVAMRLGGQYEFFKGISLNLAVGRGRNQGVVESLGLIGLTINR